MKNQSMTNSNHVIQYVVSPEDLKEIIKELTPEIRLCVQKANEEEDNNRLVNIETALKILHKGRTTLWRWEKCGYLRPVMKGTRKLYRYSDLVKIKSGVYEGGE